MAVAALLAVAGCVSVHPRAGFDDASELVARRTPYTLRWDTGTPEDSLVDRRLRAMLHGELGADTAVQVALLRNARLQSTFEEIGIAQADLVQAGLLRNPVFSVAWLFGTAPGVQSAGLIIPFVDLLQRPLRQRVALERADAVTAQVADAVLRLVADVRVAFAEATAAREMLTLRESTAQATSASAVVAKAMHDAGNVSDLDLASERALAAQARVDLRLTRANAAVARERLVRLMGLPTADSSWTVPSRLPLPPDDALALERVEALAIANRLDFAAAFKETEAAARAADFTRAFALLPDGQIGVLGDREPDGTFVGPTLQVPLPLFDQGQATVSAAQARYRQALRRHEALRIEILADSRALRETLVAARERALYFRNDVLPLRHMVLVESQKHFNAMDLSLFTLLMAKQGEIDAGVASVGAVKDYWVARAELERAVGGSFTPRAAALPASETRRTP